MTLKSILYVLTIPFVLYTLEGLQINTIFKKNRVMQARLFYLFICLIMSYLLVNFFYDFFLNTKII